MKLAPVLLLFLAGCAAVAPRLDPSTLGAAPAEERFTLGVGDSVVEVDHLRVEADSVRGRVISAKDSSGRSEIAVARDTTLQLRRAHHGGPGLEFVMLPPLFLVGVMLIFRAGYGSD